MKRAFEFLAATDWTAMEPGIHEIEGRDIYANVMERELKKKATRSWRCTTPISTFSCS